MYNVYKLYINRNFVGYTNNQDRKVIVSNERINYFGVYDTPRLAYEAKSNKLSAQYWVKDNEWKLKKYISE